MGETSVRKKHQREQVKHLLAQGFTKSEAADKCGVSRQSVIRWSKEADFIAAIANADFVNELLEETDPAKGEKASSGASLKSKNLRVDLDKQRELTIAADDIVVGLLPICQAMITRLQQNPDDVPPRLLPQIAKAIIDISKLAKESRSRAITIEGLIRHEEHDLLFQTEFESLTDTNRHLAEIQRTQRNLLKDCDYVRNKFLELVESLDPDRNSSTLVKALTSGINSVYDLKMKALGMEELLLNMPKLTPTEEVIIDADTDDSQHDDRLVENRDLVA
ncbi:MAG: helix-turn-helix domain-containing protein [Spirirestis rafaelensis WJT71-NPBG6]|jgi:transcriptional regulator with XRE-family HTH domain|nr:helix-turn-helix domain-containing protein [Spirirestis rafaelensis WJT71-NPBG6]